MTTAGDSIEQSVESMTTSWLEQAKAGHDGAWERLDLVYRKLAAWWCLRGGVPEADVDDVVQEIFVAVRTSLAKYRQQSFRGWLWTIAKARIQDYWRRREKQFPARGGALEEILADVEAESSRSGCGPSPETKILFDEIVSMVKSEFNDCHWRAFWMRTVDGRDAADVAEELDVTRTVVHNATSRIRRRINQEFGGLFEAE